MKQKGALFLGIFLLLLAGAGAFGFYYLGKSNHLALLASTTPIPELSPAASPVQTSVPEITPAGTTPPVGWLTYANSEYGFQIFYPPDYQALDDQDNLYGWPNGVVLFYGGGQSYDLAVEIWNSQSEYQAKYQNQMGNLTVHQIGNQYLTLLNTNSEPVVDQIIATFQVGP